MTQSASHKHFAIADLEWMVMTALPLIQDRLLHHEGCPIGAALLAILSDEVEARLSTPPVRLRRNEWKYGHLCWLVDLIAPGATVENKLASVILADLQQTALSGQKFKFNCTGATSKRGVMTISGISDAA